MRKIILLLPVFLLSISLFSTPFQGHTYKFRLTLKNKGNTAFSTDAPEEFLSAKAIERRAKQNIKVDESDLPISDEYLKKIENTGGIIVAKSKWNNTVAVHCTDSLMRQQLAQLPFVEDIALVWKSKRRRIEMPADSSVFFKIMEPPIDSLYYGYAYDNIRIVNGDSLHAKGFKGEGMTIGVIDAGFNNFPQIEYFDNINLMGYKNFVHENQTLFKQENQHGTNVISCIATNHPNRFVGTAPHADFWLLGSEDYGSEYPIEEDYWAAAIEFADSVGIDVVNTSLGYIAFDAPAASYTRDILDGKSALISKAADIAAQKGMLIVVSAGNSGKKEWGKISVPADAQGVLAVGSISRDSIISSFSSRGLTADLRIKPDVVGLGSNAALIDENGSVSLKSGTSFASPIICGLAACLWQAFPSLTNYELMEVLRQSSDRCDDPSIEYGYGIPDMNRAMKIAEKYVERKEKR